jgi:hypothetical protein
MAINNPTFANKGLATAAAKRKGMTAFDVRPKGDKFELVDLNGPLYNADKRERSTVEGAVAIVWDIAADMLKQGAARKDILAACVNAGVALNTARTQYQHYRKAAGLVKATS